MSTATRTSSHHFRKTINKQKQIAVNEFIIECNRVKSLMIIHMWNNSIEMEGKNGNKYICAPNQGYYAIPKFFDPKIIPDLKTNLSARALSSLTGQVCGMLKAATKKTAKRQYILNQLKTNTPEKSEEIAKLQKKTDKNTPVIPTVNPYHPIEVTSLCVEISESENDDNHFDAFVILRCIGKEFGKISIPLSYHKQSNKIKNKPNSKRLNSILLTSEKVDLRWKFDIPEKKQEGLIAGADTGKTSPVVLSTFVGEPIHPQGQTATILINNLCKKEKGSKSFKKAKITLDNYTRWYVNQLNLSQVRQINLENISNIKKGRSLPKSLTHWSNPVTATAIENRCELEGVLLKSHPSTYYSQRCFSCGLVRKANRKGKEYKCKVCGNTSDADLNSARNHTLNLMPIPWRLRCQRKNLGAGFYWLESGLFLIDGSELIVPDTSKAIV